METPYNFYPFNYSKGEKWIYNNRCVIKVVKTSISPEANELLKLSKSSGTWMCGYVVLPKAQVPKDWCINYGANGLNRLAIHGNITYCEVHGCTNEEEIRKTHMDKIQKLYDNMKPGSSYDAINNLLEEKRAIIEKLMGDLYDAEGGYVVFGFDCNHAWDRDNSNLKDPNHVMMLVEQMEQQLRDFAEVYDQYKEAETNPVIKDTVQMSIIATIKNKAEFKTQDGLGGLLDVLKGDKPREELE